MKTRLSSILLLFLMILPFGHATADEYDDTIKLFRDAPESKPFFNKAYGYAVFPLIG